MTAVAATGTIFVGLAALLHVLFFLLESVWFEKPFAWKRFGVADQEKALVIKPWAYNQGFYNLFLALGAGLVLVRAVSRTKTDGVQDLLGHLH